MKTQPNGNIPPIKELGTGWDNQFWSGISRGIWLVLTGGSAGYHNTIKIK